MTEGLRVAFLTSNEGIEQVELTAPAKQPPDTSGLAGRVGIPMTLTFRIHAPSSYTAAAKK